MKSLKLIAILYSVVFYVFTINSVLAFVPMAMLLEDTTLEEDSTAQHTFAASDVTLTINGGVTFGTASGNSQIDTASTNSSIIIDEDALIRELKHLHLLLYLNLLMPYQFENFHLQFQM